VGTYDRRREGESFIKRARAKKCHNMKKRKRASDLSKVYREGRKIYNLRKKAAVPDDPTCWSGRPR